MQIQSHAFLQLSENRLNQMNVLTLFLYSNLMCMYLSTSNLKPPCSASIWNVFKSYKNLLLKGEILPGSNSPVKVFQIQLIHITPLLLLPLPPCKYNPLTLLLFLDDGVGGVVGFVVDFSKSDNKGTPKSHGHSSECNCTSANKFWRVKIWWVRSISEPNRFQIITFMHSIC